jgi:hypothetical protein
MHSTAFAAVPTARSFEQTPGSVVLSLLPEPITQEIIEVSNIDTLSGDN